MSIDYNYKKYKPEIFKFPDGNSRIRCRIRKIQVIATPEEKVRQAFLNYLIDEKKFPQLSIAVEKNFAHYHKGVLDRADIVVFDDNSEPLIIYECKINNHGFTDEFINQGMRYLSYIQECPYVGFVSGTDALLFKQNGSNVEKLQLIKDHPDYKKRCKYDISNEKHIENSIYRYDYTHPVDIDVLDDFFDFAWLGKKTDDKFHSFLVNFNNWLLDYEDTLIENDDYKDIGTVYTKFGNAGGGNYLGQYRAIVSKKRSDRPAFCIGLTSGGSEKSGYGTLLYMGIKAPSSKHGCLQLRINNSVIVENRTAHIYHSGAMTVGRLGTMKRSDVINYIKSKSPELVVENKIFLGSFNFSEDIASHQNQTIDFVRRLLQYGLLREELRLIQKNKK